MTWLPPRCVGVIICRMLADLHLHLYGMIRSHDVLHRLATSKRQRWERYEDAMRAAFGAIPPIKEVLERYRRGVADAAEAFHELFVLRAGDAGDFDRFRAKFYLLTVGSAVKDPEAPAAEVEAEIRDVVAGLRADQRRNGISHSEVRAQLGPSMHDRVMIDTLLDTFDTGDDGPTMRLAISLDRADPWAGWDRVRELAVGPSGHVLTGIDFSADEEPHPPKGKAEFFAAVREFNGAHPDRALAILYHVGESFRDKSLESAVRWVQQAAEFGAHRLGHAIALGVDPDVFGPHTRQETVAERLDQIAYDLDHCEGLRSAGVAVDRAALVAERAALDSRPADAVISIEYDRSRLDDVRRRQRYAMDRIAAIGSVIEVCPTSNRLIGGIEDPAHHPVHRFLDAGLRVIIGSDNPGILDTTLDAELDWVCRHTGGGAELRRELVETAWAGRSEILSGRAATHRPDTGMGGADVPS